jgi:hypothetical protein
MDKIPIFDSLGKYLGDLIPLGSGGGCVAGLGVLLIMALCFVGNIQFFAFGMFIATIVGLFWSISRPATFPNRKVYIIIFACLAAMGLIYLIAWAAV